MAITDPDSVLILGAGASAPFDLPLGGELIDLIIDHLDLEIRGLETRLNHTKPLEISFFSDGPRFDRAKFLYLTYAMPDALALEGQGDRKKNFERFERLSSLRSVLRNQTSQTIDDFIALNPLWSDSIKLAIATVFFFHLYDLEAEQKTAVWNLKPHKGRHLDDRRKGVRRNWVHHLINLVRHQNFDRSHSIHPVKIISFNYDGILESILKSQFNNTEHRFEDWDKYFKFVHPHGYMGIPPRTVWDPVKLIREWADAICVVRESSVPEETADDRKTARNWISEARKIYMVGFALSGPNANLLGLGDFGNRPQRWFAANYDGSPSLSRTLESYRRDLLIPVQGASAVANEMIADSGHIEIEIQSGSRDDPLHIDTWFQIGIPGEMPA